MDSGASCSVYTFQCPAYNSWYPNEKPHTHYVPIGDFCSDSDSGPELPECASGEDNSHSLTVDINDGEGTQCVIKMQERPGTEQWLILGRADRSNYSFF